MKKFIFIFASLFATTMVDAQITLEYSKTLPQSTNQSSYAFIPTPIVSRYVSIDGTSMNSIFQPSQLLGNLMKVNGSYIDLDTYSTIEIPDFTQQVGNLFPGHSSYSCQYIAKGYFTADDRICYVISVALDKYNDNKWHFYIFDENGTLIQSLGSAYKMQTGFFMVKGKYKFFVLKHLYDNSKTTLEIYSLPGNGDNSVSGVNEIPAPRHNARKYLYNDQVLIENNENTYNIQGQLVK